MTRHRSEDAAGEGICWLGDPASQDPALVGEAVACLSRLADLDCVPPAFCLAAPPLGVLADGTLARGATSIAGMYARLARLTGQPDPPVVVRSALVTSSRLAASWVAEPWTFWNVAGQEALRTAITECAAPYVSDRARSYRQARPGQAADVRLAIVVQQFIAAGACAQAGLGTGGEIVIRSRWGIREFAPDSGWDTTIVRLADSAVIQRTIADKRQMTVADRGGVVAVDVPPASRLVASVDDAQARQLAELTAVIHQQVRGPVTAEVAWSGGQMHLIWCEPGQVAAPASPATS